MVWREKHAKATSLESHEIESPILAQEPCHRSTQICAHPRREALSCLAILWFLGARAELKVVGPSSATTPLLLRFGLVAPAWSMRPRSPHLSARRVVALGPVQGSSRLGSVFTATRDHLIQLTRVLWQTQARGLLFELSCSHAVVLQSNLGQHHFVAKSDVKSLQGALRSSGRKNFRPRARLSSLTIAFGKRFQEICRPLIRGRCPGSSGSSQCPQTVGCRGSRPGRAAGGRLDDGAAEKVDFVGAAFWPTRLRKSGRRRLARAGQTPRMSSVTATDSGRSIPVARHLSKKFAHTI